MASTPPTDPSFAEVVSDFVALVGLHASFLSELQDWATGTATGGPNGDGYYPFTMPDGSMVYVPAPPLLAGGGSGYGGGNLRVIGDLLVGTQNANILQVDSTNRAVNLVGQLALAKMGGGLIALINDGGGNIVGDWNVSGSINMGGKLVATQEYVNQHSGGSTGGDVDLSDLEEVSIQAFYADSNSTDQDAFNALASAITTGMLNDCRVVFPSSKGRGPSARYIVSDEVLFDNPGGRVVLDFGEATIRYTSTNSKWRYRQAPQASSAIQPQFFIMRGGTHQLAADQITCIGHWDFPYQDSRLLGTGYAENMRILPQTSTAAHSCLAAFKISNTWYFSAKRIHVTNKSAVPAQLIAGSTFIRQEGVCVVTVMDNVETNYFDTNFVPGFLEFTGMELTFSSGTYARGKVIRQGGVTGTLGRNNGKAVYGYTYGVYGVQGGAFQTGTADLLDSTGAVVGQVSITALGLYQQPSEAIHSTNGSTYIGCNSFMSFATPAQANAAGHRLLQVTMTDSHIAFYKNGIKADGINALMVGPGCLFAPQGEGAVTFDITNGDFVNVIGMNSSTNGVANCTFARLRNVNFGNFSSVSLAYYRYSFDTDNTVKDTAIHNTTALYGADTTKNGDILNTGKRFNAANPRGIRFRSNGYVGRDVDTDSNRRRTWSPAVSAASGSINSFTVSNAYYVVSNGVLTFNCKIAITDRGSASGIMRVSMPKLPQTNGDINLPYDFACPVSIGNNMILGLYNPSSGNVEVHAGSSVNNTIDNAFALADQPGNFVYYVQGSVPVEYD